MVNTFGETLDADGYTQQRRRDEGLIAYTKDSLQGNELEGELSLDLDELSKVESKLFDAIALMSEVSQTPRPGDEMLLTLLDAEITVLEAERNYQRERIEHPAEADALELWLASQLDAYEAQGALIDDDMRIESQLLAKIIREASPEKDELGIAHIAKALQAEHDAQRAYLLLEQKAKQSSDYLLAA